MPLGDLHVVGEVLKRECFCSCSDSLLIKRKHYLGNKLLQLLGERNSVINVLLSFVFESST